MPNVWHYIEVMFEGNLRSMKSIQDELNKLWEQRYTRSETDDMDTKKMRALAIRQLERELEYEQAQFGRFIWNLYTHELKKRAEEAIEAQAPANPEKV